MKLVRKKIEKRWMYLNLDDGGISRRLWLKGKREQCFNYLMRKQTGNVALDCGANLGHNSIWLVDKFAQVFSFEPDPRSAMLLDKNLSDNTKVTISRMALSDNVGKVKFCLSKKPNMSAIGRTDGKFITVPTTTVDKYFGGAELNFIKADLEGGEVGLLNGARETIEKWHPTILLEVHPGDYSETNNFREILLGLAAIGYRIPYVISAKIHKDKFKVPTLFKEHGYEPYKTFKGEKRAIFKIKTEHAIDWCSREIPDGTSKKIIRAIMLEYKGGPNG